MNQHNAPGIILDKELNIKFWQDLLMLSYSVLWELFSEFLATDITGESFDHSI